MKSIAMVFGVAAIELSSAACGATVESAAIEFTYEVRIDNGGYTLIFQRAGKETILANTDAEIAKVFAFDIDDDGCGDAIFYEGGESGFNISVYQCENGKPLRKVYAENVEREVDILDFDADGRNELVFFESVQELGRQYPYYLFPIVYKQSSDEYIRTSIYCIAAARKFYEEKIRAWASFFKIDDAIELSVDHEKNTICP